MLFLATVGSTGLLPRCNAPGVGVGSEIVAVVLRSKVGNLEARDRLN